MKSKNSSSSEERKKKASGKENRTVRSGSGKEEKLKSDNEQIRVGDKKSFQAERAKVSGGAK